MPIHKCKTTHTKGFKKTIECVWDFDLTDVNPNEIMGLAMRSLVISAQRDARDTKTTDAFMAFQTQKFSVRAMIDNIRHGKSPTEKVAGLMDGMTEDDITKAYKAAIARKKQK